MNAIERILLTVAVVGFLLLANAVVRHKAGKNLNDESWTIRAPAYIGFWCFFGSLLALAIEAIWVRIP